MRNPFRRRPAVDESRMTVDDYANLLNQFQFGGLWYGGLQQTMAGVPVEPPVADFVGRASQAFGGNGVVFACMLVRQMVFSTVRFRWQRLRDGKPSDTFGSADLALFETPWPGGTTQDLLSRTIQDADLAGNSYWTRRGAELIRLRPDWVEILVEEILQDGATLGYRRAGYLYTEGGPASSNEPVPLLLNQVAHFAPIPDPLARYRGMSWLTPIVREIQSDGQMNIHKQKFLENGATPNMVIKHDAGASEDKVKRFAAWLEENHAGVSNAYKQLHLYPGADATVVGADFKQLDFKTVQGAGETRIAAAAGVPPVIVGLSEGLQGSSLNAGNYGQARRRLADGTAHPLWQNVAGSFAPLVPSQGSDARLWYDTTDVPFLREDEKDAAEIAERQAGTIRTLIDAGFTPESVVKAVESGDWRLLKHTGMFSVQLQPPGAPTEAPPVTVTDPEQANSLLSHGWRPYIPPEEPHRGTAA